MRAYKILHIAPHIGGGVGDTVLGFISESIKYGYEHDVTIFGYANCNISNRAYDIDVKLWTHMDHKLLLEMIPNYDIILLHVWNHPLLYDFLVRNKLPPCRLIMWAHNSGFYPPNIYTEKIIKYPDMFVLTTPLSYELKEVEKLKNKQRFYNIWSNNGTKQFADIKPKKHKDFIVGYIGTVDYAKLHRNFLNMCKEINIPDVKFVVVGGTKEKEIQKEAEELGIKIKFTGWVELEKLLEIVRTFDVFGYPLTPKHYGTCDLTLQLAMACGVVPVVLDNPMESFMVKNMVTGIVSSEENYAKNIKMLYHKRSLRNMLSTVSRIYALRDYSLEKLEREWRKTLDIVMELPKKERSWDISLENITAADVFLESLGIFAEPFKNDDLDELSKDDMWQTSTKGSVHNYHFYFSDDPDLTRWSSMMSSQK